MSQNSAICRSLLWDLGCAGGVALLGAVVCAWFSAAHMPARGVWTSSVDSSIAVALGLGHVALDYASIPEVKDFIEQKTAALDTSAFPADLETKPLGYFQTKWNYLYWLLGMYWRHAGIRWDNLGPLMGFFYGFTCAVLFGLFRLGMGRGIALAAAVFMIFSPVALLESTGYRDLSKAPFMLGTVLLLGWLMKAPRGSWLIAACGVFLGVFLAVGMRFRFDCLMAVPGAMIALALFLPGPFRQNGPARLAACLAMGLIFYIWSKPIFDYDKKEGGLNYHNMIMGLGEIHNRHMNVGNVPYDHGYFYNDSLADHATGLHALINRSGKIHFRKPSPENDRLGRDHLLHVYRTFPADQILRWYAAAFNSLDVVPFTTDGHFNRVTHELPDPLLRLHAARWSLFGLVFHSGRLLAVGALALIAVHSPLLALGALFLFVFFTGYTSLQYDPRHYFHTEVFAWWVLFFCAAQALRALRARRAAAPILPAGITPRAAAARAGLVLLAAGLLLWAPLAAARVYQHRAVGSLYQRYAEAPRQPLQANPRPYAAPWLQSGWLLYEIEDLFEPGRLTDPGDHRQAWGDYLMVSVTPGAEPVSLVAEYDRAALSVYHRDFVIPASSGGNTQFFLPVYKASDTRNVTRFLGLAVPAAQAHRIAGFYRVAPERGLPLHLTLPPRWETLPRYYRMIEAELPYPAWTAHASRPGGSRIFDAWKPPMPAPPGFIPPEDGSTIEAVNDADAGGIVVKQIWTSAEARHRGGLHGFRLPVTGLDPNTEYAWLCRARQPEPGKFRTAIHALTVHPDNTISTRELGGVRATHSGDATGWRDYAFRFTTGTDPSAYTVLTVTYVEDALPKTIYWDDWRLVQLRRRIVGCVPEE